MGLVIAEPFLSPFISFQVETRYNTPPSELETCQFDLTVETVEDVNKLLQKDQIVIGKPKKSKHPKKQRKKCKKGRTQKCKRKGKDKGEGKGSGKKQKRLKNKKVPKLQAHQPVSNNISFKVCARYDI